MFNSNMKITKVAVPAYETGDSSRFSTLEEAIEHETRWYIADVLKASHEHDLSSGDIEQVATVFAKKKNREELELILKNAANFYNQPESN